MDSGNEGGAGARSEPYRVGVLGTLVWDQIRDRSRESAPVEAWGGICYSIEGMAAALPDGWVLRPLLKVGADLFDRALEYLLTIPNTEVGPGIEVVQAPNPTVKLEYKALERISERLEGRVPPWDTRELEPLLAGVDALYINFITGLEMGLETARSLKEVFGGPIYADLHSLFLGISPDGYRFPRALEDWASWMKAFHAVQMNESEFLLLGEASDDPWHLAGETVGQDLGLVAVTLGDRGAGFVAAPGFSTHPGSWVEAPELVGGARAFERCFVAPPPGTLSLDPTGCGDVWGATFFGRLLAGDPMDTAMTAANRSAARNAEIRGAQGLHLHLRFGRNP